MQMLSRRNREGPGKRGLHCGLGNHDSDITQSETTTFHLEQCQPTSCEVAHQFCCCMLLTESRCPDLHFSGIMTSENVRRDNTGLASIGKKYRQVTRFKPLPFCVITLSSVAEYLSIVRRYCTCRHNIWSRTSFTSNLGKGSALHTFHFDDDQIYLEVRPH